MTAGAIPKCACNLESEDLRSVKYLQTGGQKRGIDGSKFKAVNARDKNFTEAKMKRRLERIDESIARYLSQLETADRHGDAVMEAKVARLKSKIEKLKEEIVRLNAINAEMMCSLRRLQSTAATAPPVFKARPGRARH